MHILREIKTFLSPIIIVHLAGSPGRTCSTCTIIYNNLYKTEFLSVYVVESVTMIGWENKIIFERI